MFKSHLTLVAAITIIALSLLGTTSIAQAEASKPNDLKSYACKDVMLLSGEDRDLALAFVHGYFLGKKDTTQFKTEELAVLTDNFLDYCLDHPTENALKAFEKQVK